MVNDTETINAATHFTSGTNLFLSTIIIIIIIICIYAMVKDTEIIKKE